MTSPRPVSSSFLASGPDFPAGTRRENRLAAVCDACGFVLLILAVAAALVRGAEDLGYNWQWYRVPRYLFGFDAGGFVAGPLLTGLWVTLKITVAAFVLAFAFGLAAALLRLSSSLAGRVLARGYLELIRNTPLLIQIFFIYFVLGPALGLDRLPAAILALALFEGAYASEIIRAGIEAVPRGQWEAAHSLGLSPAQAYLRVILPQAARRALPPLTSQTVSLVKDSSLVSAIAVADLTFEGSLIVADTFLTFEVWFTVAAIYLACNSLLSLAAGRIEAALAVDGGAA